MDVIVASYGFIWRNIVVIQFLDKVFTSRYVFSLTRISTQTIMLPPLNALNTDQRVYCKQNFTYMKAIEFVNSFKKLYHKLMKLKYYEWFYGHYIIVS